MTRKLIYPFILLSFLAGCSKNNVSITGTVQDAAKQQVYLEQQNVGTRQIIDSAKADSKGRFSFKTLVKDPVFYNVKVGDKESVTVIASAGEKIEISGKLEGLGRNYWVDGSDNSLWIKLLSFQLNGTRNDMDSLKRMFDALPADSANAAERARISHEWDSVVNRQAEFSRDFILKHAVSPAAYYALYQKFDGENYILNPVTDLHSFKTVASSMKAMFPESQYTQAILKHLQQIGNDMRNLQIRQLIANSETSLPEIRLADVQGDTVAFSSLKGHYIVLDFNLLGAKESKDYVGHLHRIYRKFKDRGVEIYQVCLDQNLLAWKNLVRQYGIDWTCVRDADGSNSKAAQSWNVRTIPANYIINPQFEIVGKNLSGRRLEERLEDLLKK